jgi:hypothetical protein
VPLGTLATVCCVSKCSGVEARSGGAEPARHPPHRQQRKLEADICGIRDGQAQPGKVCLSGALARIGYGGSNNDCAGRESAASQKAEMAYKWQSLGWVAWLISSCGREKVDSLLQCRGCLQVQRLHEDLRGYQQRCSA